MPWSRWPFVERRKLDVGFVAFARTELVCGGVKATRKATADLADRLPGRVTGLPNGSAGAERLPMILRMGWRHLCAFLEAFVGFTLFLRWLMYTAAFKEVLRTWLVGGVQPQVGTGVTSDTRRRVVTGLLATLAALGVRGHYWPCWPRTGAVAGAAFLQIGCNYFVNYVALGVRGNLNDGWSREMPGGFCRGNGEGRRGLWLSGAVTG